MAGVLQGEEYQHPHEGRAGVERRREHVIVLLPPPLVVAEHEEVEDHSGEEPAGNVGGCRRRHSGKAVGDDGDVNERNPFLVGEDFAESPNGNREDCSDEEKPDEVAVKPAGPE